MAYDMQPLFKPGIFGYPAEKSEKAGPEYADEKTGHKTGKPSAKRIP
jgi:hypothetical protein